MVVVLKDDNAPIKISVWGGDSRNLKQAEESRRAPGAINTVGLVFLTQEGLDFQIRDEGGNQKRR